MNIGSKSGIKQNGQDFGWMRDHGDSSRLRTSTTANCTSTSSPYSKSNSNNYNGLFSSSSSSHTGTIDGGHTLKSQSWAESCIEPSFLTSPCIPSANSSSNSKFSVFGDPIQSSFSSYSDCNSHQPGEHTESFLSHPKRTGQDTYSTNTTDANVGQSKGDGGHLESSLASMSLHSKTETDRRAPLTIEGKREGSTVPKSWASIASQPVKTGKTASLLKTKMAAASALTASTRPAPIVASLEAIGSWEAKNGSPKSTAIASPPVQASNVKRSPWSSSFSASSSTSSDPTPDQSCSSTSSGRDSPSSSSQSVTSGNNNSCNSTTSNNNKSITSNISSGIASGSENNSITSNNNNSTSNISSGNSNSYCGNSNYSTSGCSFNSNNSSSFVAQRRPGPLTSCSSIESSVSSSNRVTPASVNHRSSSNASTGGVLTGRQVHVSTGGLRDARHEKENGYRESNNHYVNSHKRNWRESNVDTATVTNDTIGNSSSSNNGANNNCHNQVQSVQRRHERTVSGGSGGSVSASGNNSEKIAHLEPVVDPSAIMDKQKLDNLFNPKEFDLNPTDARFFVIKSYSEDDIHRSIKYSIWCSTEHGNKRLDNAFKSQEGKGPVYLFYSVNGSGHFCGMAQMVSGVDYDCSVNVWAQDKWKGQFKVKWIYVKDVPNASLRHIRLENNENKQVTNSRDTQEVPLEKGKQVLKVIHSYVHSTSIFDDFLHYEKRQEEELSRKIEASTSQPAPPVPAPADALRPRKDHTLTSHRENLQPDGHSPSDEHNRDKRERDRERDHDQRDRDHMDMHREYRDHRDHPPSSSSSSLSSSVNHRGDFHRDHRTNSHKAPLQPSDRRPYERRYDTGDNSAHRDHRYSNNSVRNYDQCAPRDQPDSYYHSTRRPAHHNNYYHHNNFQQQGHAPHYHSNSSSDSSHHNRPMSWRE